MSYKVPNFRHPDLPRNELGYTSKDYEGAVSTLCAGCGHDSISAAIIDACFLMSIQPHRVAKLSGIGCSSKTPTYFLGNSHGFNSVHGRMPSVATGANMANRNLLYIGVSGDGDTAFLLKRCERRGFIVRLPAAALGDNGAAAGTDGEAFCVNLCERRGFLLRLPVHAAAYGDDAAAV